MPASTAARFICQDKMSAYDGGSRSPSEPKASSTTLTTSIMSITSPGKFYVDEKYETVKSHLESAGWTSSSIDDTAVNLIWTNLSKLDFAVVPKGCLVNHFRGAHNWSNKSYFSYHMTASGNHVSMPKHWSPCHENVHDLISLIVGETVYSVGKLLASKIDDPSTLALVTQELQYLSILNRRLDEYLPEWGEKSLYKKLFKLEITYLSTHLSINSSTTITPSSDFYGKLNEVLKEIEDSSSSECSWRKPWAGIKNIWIIKPVGLSCGQGISVVNDIKGIFDLINTFSCKCIVQKYIERPLLVSDRKFDIRQWVLVKRIDPLEIHGFSECYLRLSSKKFTLDELTNPLIHLCNHSIQVTGEGFEDTETMISQDSFNDNYLRKHSFFRNFPAEYNPFYDHIQPAIIAASVKAVSAVRDKINKVENGFEWLGLDFMISDDMQVFLIEVNTSPDITFSTDITTRLVSEAIPKLFSVLSNQEDPKPPTTKGLHWQRWYPSEPNNNDSSSSSSDSGGGSNVTRKFALEYVPSIDSVTKMKRQYGPMYSSNNIPGADVVANISTAFILPISRDAHGGGGGSADSSPSAAADDDDEDEI